MTDIELLRAAKERLFEKGWKQGSLGLEPGPNCLVGALFHTLNVIDSTHSVYQFLAENINVDGWRPGNHLWKVEYFNDQASTTFDDIIDLIDRTIKTLEQEQE